MKKLLIIILLAILSIPDEMFAQINEDYRSTVTNLGRNICSEWSEYAPVISQDGKTIFFCRDSDEINKDNPLYLKKTGEDIWRSDFVNGRWTVAKLVEELNTDLSEVVVSVYNNKTEIIIFRNAKLYHCTQLADGSWSDAERLGAPFDLTGVKYYDINYSVDGKHLLYTAQTGLTGSKDIYACEKEIDGVWSDPILLDSIINSSKSERSPQLAADGKTMYFSSSGHGGSKCLDVFRTVMGDDITQWSKPVNLGRSINTNDPDWFFIVPASGDKAYYSSNHSIDNYGQNDIYRIDLCENLRPEDKVAEISGVVVDGKGKPLIAVVVCTEIESKEVVYECRTQFDGKFFMSMTLGKRYVINAKKDGYYSQSHNFDLRDIDLSGSSDVHKKYIKIRMLDIEYPEYGGKIRFNVFFDYNSSILLSESDLELETMLSSLKKYKDLIIEVTGHTDSTGINHSRLSAARARAVVDYFIENGIPERRLKAVGRGCNEPICPESTEECFAKNRRVEIIFVDNRSQLGYKIPLR
jgi:OOP family OmpA-OmpF porin